MKKPAIVFILYLTFLLVIRLLLNRWQVTSIFLPYSQGRLQAEFNSMLPFTILGGLLALYVLVNAKAFKLFVLIYLILWGIRIFIYVIGNRYPEVTIAERNFHLNLIADNYYNAISRLETPFPFIIYWMLLYVFERYFRASKNE